MISSFTTDISLQFEQLNEFALNATYSNLIYELIIYEWFTLVTNLYIILKEDLFH